MKKYSRYLLSLVAILALVLLFKVPGKAASNLVQTASSANAVTVVWTAPTLSSGSTLTGYSFKLDSRENVLTAAPGATSTTITGLPANYVGYLQLSYTYTTSYGGPYTGYVGSTYINTALTAPAKESFVASGVLTYTSKVCFNSARPNSEYRTQLQIFKGNSATPCNTLDFISSSEYVGIKKNTAYRYRIRFYYKNYNTGAITYSPWSPYRGFMLNKIKYRKSGNTFTLSFNKAKFVTKYVVKASKKYDTGFKKAKTIKPKNKKSYKVKVTAKKKSYFRVYTYLKLKEFKGLSDVIVRN